MCVGNFILFHFPFSIFRFQFIQHLLERLVKGRDDGFAEEIGEGHEDELPFGNLRVWKGQLSRFASNAFIQKDVNVDSATVIEGLSFASTARFAGASQLFFNFFSDV